jgi:DNA-binding beta-propeller fold protein YncE
MVRRLSVRIALFVAAVFNLTTVAVNADDLFWTDNDDSRIYRSALDGSNRQIVMSLGTGVDPRGLAIDSNAGLMYWAENGTNRIRRANLDGSNPQTIVNTNVAFPADVELDLTAGKIYWADRDLDWIRRANLDGTGVETVLNLPAAGNTTAPYFLELEPAGGKIYWTDFESGIIHRANMTDGSGIENFVTGLVRTRDVVVDSADGKIYWNDRDTSRVHRENLGGGSRETLFGPGGLVQPHGLVLHDATNMLYWADGDARLIGSGPQNGGVPFTTVSSGGAPFHPWDIDIAVTPIPEPSTIAIATIGLVAAAIARLGRNCRNRALGIFARVRSRLSRKVSRAFFGAPTKRNSLSQLRYWV